MDSNKESNINEKNNIDKENIKKLLEEKYKEYDKMYNEVKWLH